MDGSSLVFAAATVGVIVMSASAMAGRKVTAETGKLPHAAEDCTDKHCPQFEISIAGIPAPREAGESA